MKYGVMFKSEPSLWEMVRDGRKRWEARLPDAKDPRWKLLARWNHEDTVFIHLWNIKTGEVLRCQLTSILTPPTMGAWVLMGLTDVGLLPDRRAFQPEPWEIL